MSLSRRDFLRLGALTATAASVAGCQVVGRELAQADLPDTLSIPDPGAATDPSPLMPNKHLRFLNRAGYGPRPGDLVKIEEMGLEAYLEEQLAYEALDDTAVDLQTNSFNVVLMDVSQLINRDGPEIVRELGWYNMLRKLHSKRQLYEAMVEFWADHFHIYIGKSMFMPALRAIDEREVIRPHALGNFRDLLFASAYSPAMLHYLDNAQNRAAAPNENYARELLELHTLGVHAGYTQQDVAEAARVLTGLSLARRGRQQGQTIFRPEEHDNGEKVVRGELFPAGQGEQDIAQLLEMLAVHPATADFIATKLVRRFVADDPPAALVSQVAETFLQTEGDIKSMLRVIFLSDDFATAPLKLKRPFTYMISLLRALHVDVSNGRPFVRWLRLLGQPLYGWPAPNGYPDESAAWTQTLLARWNFALAIMTNSPRGVTVPLEEIAVAGGINDAHSGLDIFAGVLTGRVLSAGDKTLFTEYVGEGQLNRPETRRRLAEAVALMAASPAFQWT